MLKDGTECKDPFLLVLGRCSSVRYKHMSGKIGKSKYQSIVLCISVATRTGSYLIVWLGEVV